MNWKRALVAAFLQISWMAGAAAQPTIFWFNDPVGPDDTVLVTGADLGGVTSATVRRVEDAGTNSTPAPETAAVLLQVNPQSLKFIIPKEFAPGIYRFTLTNGQGTLSGRLNLPSIYWTQGDLGEAVSPSGTIQVFGRNIVRQDGRARLVLVADDDRAPKNASLVKGDLWRGIFRLSDQIKPGRYRLRLSNGDGGDDEWVDAGSMVVRQPAPEPAQSFDIRAYGAVGNGVTDSTRAIKAAIEAASNSGGGTVFLPRGRYLVSEQLVLPPHVSLRGERTDLVNLVWPDLANPPINLIEGRSHFSIEDLTIYASNHLNVISGGYFGRDVEIPDAGDIAIRRVRIRALAFRDMMDQEAVIQRMRDIRRLLPEGTDAILLRGNHIEVTDCDVLGSGNSLHLVKVIGAIVFRNTLANGRDGHYLMLGSRKVIFENNLVVGADLQASGGGVTTLSRSVSSSEDVYVGANTFRALYGLDREAMTSDGPAGYYFGHAESTSSSLLTLTDAPDPYPVASVWTRAMVMVVNGRGAGQYARVSSTTGNGPGMTVELDRPLQIPLDSTSEITIVQAHEDYLIINNDFEDTGVAAQAFGTALGHVIAGNRSKRSSGFAAIGLIYGHLQPVWRIQFLDNEIIEGNAYRAGPDKHIISNEASIFVRANQVGTNAGRPPLVQAVIVRGNRLDQDAHIRIEGFSIASPGIRDVVVEANSIGPSRIGIVVDRGVASWLGRRNFEAGRLTK